MSRHCPQCGYGDSSRERRPNGKTTCNACEYSVPNEQWDIEEAEVEFLSEPTVAMCQEEITKLQALVVSLQDYIDVLVDANEAVHQDKLGHFMDYCDEKHETEKLELKILDLEKEIETLKAEKVLLKNQIEYLEEQLDKYSTEEN